MRAKLPSKNSNQSGKCKNVTALFAGIGGLEHGLKVSGHQTSVLCEIDPTAQAVLRRQFPGVRLLPDVRQTEKLLAAIDPQSNLLTAGFPCTDISQAGLTLGFAGKQSGLIVDVLKLLARRPFESVLIENVPNWRFLHGGEYLRAVIVELEKLGYCWAYRVIDALAFGLPQRRQRIFLFATKSGDPRSALFAGNEEPDEVERGLRKVAHGFYWTEGNRGLGWGEDCVPTLKGGSGLGIPSAPAVLLPNGAIITPDIRDAERLQGLPAGWTRLPDATNEEDRRRWRLVGNAVNVEVAKWIGRNLLQSTRFEGPEGEELREGDPFPQAAWYDGTRRRRANLTTWPVKKPRKPLADFLKHPGKPLSYRATQGFFSRANNSSLRFADGFLVAVDRHLKRMEAAIRDSQEEHALQT